MFSRELFDRFKKLGFTKYETEAYRRAGNPVRALVITLSQPT